MKPHPFSRSHDQRIGLFGGTFDPVHRGHLQVAGDVLQRLDLEVVYFIPSALPPHKSTGRVAPAGDRLEMVRIALQHHPDFRVCRAEIDRQGPSYSIDTVCQIKSILPAGHRLFFMLGLDAFLEIHTWKDFERLFDETALAVMSRPGAGLFTTATARRVEAYTNRYISSGYALNSNADRLDHPTKQSVYLVPVTPVAVSSSDVRATIERGETIGTWVMPPVAQYIQQKGLYR